MERANAGRAIVGGFVATVAMTMLIYVAPLMGMPRIDIAAMLGSILQDGQMAAPQSGAWWMGMMLHFLMGTVIFSLVYAYAVYGWLKGSALLRGLVWGVTLWVLMMVMVMPMMGKGFFASATPHPFLFVMGTLMGHLVYGSLLGAIAGPQAARVSHTDFAGHNRPV